MLEPQSDSLLLSQQHNSSVKNSQRAAPFLPSCQCLFTEEGRERGNGGLEKCCWEKNMAKDTLQHEAAIKYIAQPWSETKLKLGF
jgi:hypothetical protein